MRTFGGVLAGVVVLTAFGGTRAEACFDCPGFWYPPTPPPTQEQEAAKTFYMGEVFHWSNWPDMAWMLLERVQHEYPNSAVAALAQDAIAVLRELEGDQIDCEPCFGLWNGAVQDSEPPSRGYPIRDFFRRSRIEDVPSPPQGHVTLHPQRAEPSLGLLADVREEWNNALRAHATTSDELEQLRPGNSQDVHPLFFGERLRVDPMIDFRF